MSAESARSSPGPEPSSRSTGSASADVTGPPGLIDLIVEATQAERAETGTKLREFLEARSPERALALWLSWRIPSGRLPEGGQIARMLGQDIAEIDAMLRDQVNAIIHHPKFQRLEASWLGLRYLVEQAEGAENVKIRVLSASWQELARDAERAIEFDQSQLFRKVYGAEFGMAGGEPFGVLLGDYEIRPRPSAEHPLDDIDTLTAVSHVAAAAFAPFVAGVHPAMFGLNHFASLEQPLDLRRTFDQLEYLKWRAFRETEDARFVGLTLPRVLMRLPYEDDDSRVDGFRFAEEVAGPDGDKYLWGNAAFAFGSVLIRAFVESSWLANIRGVERDVEGGGLVSGLPVHCFTTDAPGVAPKCSTDVIVTDRQEPDLSDLGFMPLCHCKDTEFLAFYANQSAQKPKKYDDPAATTNARVSAMLQYTLCVSRFSHYLKAAARDKVGAFTEAQQCEDYLYRWLQDYVTSDGEASPEVKATLPLREARVRVREHPDKPGCYLCVAHLWPHFELDELTTTLKVTTELTPGRPG